MHSQIESEFDRVLEIKNRYLKMPKDYLTIDEARQHLKSPLEQYPINFMKLPILFLLDQSLDGKFTKSDLVQFCEKISTVVTDKIVENEFLAEITSYAIMFMWHTITVDVDGFIRWLVRALVLDHRVDVPRYPDVVYVSVDVISVLYDVLDVSMMFEGLNVQQLIDLMQHVGEHEGLMNLSDQELDNVVPARVIRIFSESFVDGFERMMTRLGFVHDNYFSRPREEAGQTKREPALYEIMNRDTASSSDTEDFDSFTDQQEENTDDEEEPSQEL